MTPMKFLMGAVALGALTVGCSVEAPAGATTQHLSTAQCDAFEVGGRIVICHATGSARNPISIIRVSEAACINAHSDHPGDFVAVDGNCGPDACLPETAPCDATLRCCDGLTCNAGTCVNINACATNACGANATCTDLPAPALGDASGRTCACDAGYQGDGITCTDINACATNACGANATCTDLPAPALGDASGRTCACDPGFEGDGTTCTDINACAANPCDANAACTDLTAPAPGDASGRTCACNPGYEGNGTSCTDINECAVNNGGCSANATCTNTVGSFSCSCNSGYQGDGSSCSDVNECAVNNGGCSANATCTNNAGAPPTCACNTGYTGNGVTCTAAATPSGQVCQGGTDPHTGAAYVICRNYGNRLWISGNVGGRYHIDQVCQALGWRTAGRWDGTCGNVCGYCQGPTSCSSPGNEVLGRPFMPNNCGSDAYGPLWCNTIQWECIL